MRSYRATSEDVARLAGVSRTTVSFVLNHRRDVLISDATRRRVEAAAVELDYHAHEPARQLAGGTSRTLGLVLCQEPEQVAVDALLAETLRGLATVARGSAFRVLVEALVPGVEGYADLLHSRQVDGLVISGPRADDLVLRDPRSAALPIVLQGTLTESVVPSVDVDNHAGAREAVEHLIALGHRRVACIPNAPLAYTAAADRVAGYTAALRAAGLEADPALIAEGDFDAASGHRAMAQLLARGRDFSAVFVASDTVAVGAIAALRQAGLDVPGDVSVVGFDDVPLAAFIDPPLTTIHLPAFELGATAGQVLIERVRGGAVPAQTTLATNLVVRASTARYRAGRARSLTGGAVRG
ncbi:MAG: LacI family DNA-binding transcriptional regulator [Candidatus Limnocylindrales bacterium]